MTLPTVAEFAKGKLHLDNLKDIVSGSETVTTPEGTVHKSIAQKISEFDAAINAAGYESIGVWTSGVTEYTEFGQVAYYNGVPYKPVAGVMLPYTAQGSDPTASPDSSYVSAWRDEQSYTCATVADMQAGVAVNGMSFSGLLIDGMSIRLTDSVQYGNFTIRLAADYTSEIADDVDTKNYIQITGTDYVAVRTGNTGLFDIISVTESTTLTESHVGSVISSSSTSSITVTLPADVDVGSVIAFIQNSNGSITIAAPSGATVYSRIGGYRTYGRYSAASAICVSDNAWVLTGDLDV
jgi:hypothetical protein